MLYAKTNKIVPQILSDLGLILWIALWIFLGVKVREFVLLFAKPAEMAQETAANVSGSMATAADSVAGLPLVGPVLATPFNSLDIALGALVISVEQLISLVHTTALVLGIIVVVVPVVAYIWKWFPWRFSFVREATAGQKLLPAETSPELFALRAIAHAPMHELVKITPDPMGAWQRGDAAIIRKLADLELGIEGLRLPKSAQR
ncbi:MAG: hypothetical protein LBG99_07725 [Propionibacteriaceae bacterium]|jgi:hypothetical protein|nr:hypothetical protein [Propionibacteriaceae bacterium]